MTSPRQHLLEQIRNALGRGELSVAEKERLKIRLRRPVIYTQPKWETPDQIRFVDRLRAADATVAAIEVMHALPEALALYLQQHQLPPELVIANDPELTRLSWGNAKIHIGPNRAQYAVSLTKANYGIAETGTLVLLSSVSSPTTLNFLADHHIVLIDQENVVTHIEDVWDRLRKARTALPRTMNLITGPSRTADIEQTIQLGAHGPRYLHVFLLRAAPRY
ncbi:MAG: lactate utilization protein [Gammaproteobacteria bacterium]|nr:lactate utilization protein [Gammaproteobacteria bacterium]MCI0591264.1 lactate utilization protein [Gammaproteobacteria bacterium]